MCALSRSRFKSARSPSDMRNHLNYDREIFILRAKISPESKFEDFYRQLMLMRFHISDYIAFLI